MTKTIGEKLVALGIVGAVAAAFAAAPVSPSFETGTGLLGAKSAQAANETSSPSDATAKPSVTKEEMAGNESSNPPNTAGKPSVSKGKKGNKGG